MKKIIFLHLFVLCNILYVYSQSSAYVIFTSTKLDIKGVSKQVFEI